jgi:manganese transport protein
LVPLVLLARDDRLMAAAPTRRGTIAVAWIVAGLVVLLNLVLLVLTAVDLL